MQRRNGFSAGDRGPSYVKHTICPRHPVCRSETWEVAKRRIACSPHGSFTPTVVRTEPPNAVKRSRREYHYHSDCHRHAGGNPALEQVISLAPSGGRGVPNSVACAFALHRN